MLETTLIVLAVIVAMIATFVAGYALAMAKKSAHNLIGTLRVDNSIPEEGPHLYLELDKGIPEIKQHDYVTLRVNTESYISQK